MAKFEESTIPVELLCGILTEDDTASKDCIITAMTGGLRKQLAQPEIRKEGVKVMDAVLDSCVVSIGGEPFKSSKSYDDMLLADSDYLLMKIRQHSLGDVITMDLTCPSCSHNYKAELNISDIECYPINDEETSITEVDGKKVRTFKIETENWNCLMRYPTRADQRAIAKFAQENPIDAMHALYTRIMLEMDGEKVDGREMIKLFDSISVKYIDELSGAIEVVLPGVESNHFSVCPQCNQKIEMEVAGGDFLFTRPKERTKSKSRLG